MNIRRIGCGIVAAGMMGATVQAQEPPAAAVVMANNQFAVDLYRQARGSAPNVVFSPYSISAAFGMTYAGAAGATAAQMRDTMRWSGSAAEVASGFQALDQALASAQAKGGLQLAVANSLWPMKGYPFQPEFTGLLEREFKGSFFPADFATRPEAERARINQWVAAQTRDRITDLVPAGALTPLTRLVLCNAIYFKGQWEHAFSPSATAEAPFHVSNVHVTKCRLMRTKANYGFVEQPGFKILSMSYKGGEASMVVLLPDDPAGLPQLEQELSAEKLSAWLKQMRRQEVQVFFPKYLVRFGLQLNKAMAALGMTDAFDQGRADFSKMTGTKDLYLSAAFHKAFVEVNEEGTEAAAATGIVAATRAARPQAVPVFRADHPFIYLIRHDSTGAILFLGRMSDPGK